MSEIIHLYIKKVQFVLVFPGSVEIKVGIASMFFKLEKMFTRPLLVGEPVL